MAVREKEIPCTDCDSQKEDIERLPGHQYVSCEPIPEKPGWCLFKWKTPID